MSAQIAIVLKGYPRLSESFIAQEIYALQQRGFNLCIVSLRHPTDPDVHPVHHKIHCPVYYLPEYLHREPARVLKALFKVCHNGRFMHAVRVWLGDLRRDFSRNRVRRFGQAVVMAAELNVEVKHIYAHFLHTPASVARYAGILAGLPWSCSAHAKDIWTIMDWEKREKMSSCEWLVTCTQSNSDHLRGLSDDPQKVSLVYHGLDFDGFSRPDKTPSRRDGQDAKNPVRILSVGRAVPKKGYDILLNALNGLPHNIHWRFTLVGDGEMLSSLKQQADKLKLQERIQWLGLLPQNEVLKHYRNADIFILPSRITVDGDRDGLPNVLMEAQSQKLACISTSISGIPELIEHDVSGVLIEPDNVKQLGTALQELITHPDKREKLAKQGYAIVREKFSMNEGIDTLVEKFTASVDSV